MKLTEENRKYIDQLNMLQLLIGIRLSPIDYEFLQGETGAYWVLRFTSLRNENEDAYVQATIDSGLDFFE